MSTSPRRGAPLGNQNRRKHGYYSTLFPKTHLTGLPRVDDSLDFHPEVEILRLAIRHVIELGQGQQNFPDSIAMLRALSTATSSLSRLPVLTERSGARTQHLYDHTGPDRSDALADVVAEIENEP